jgi:hypothetical protein
MSTSLWILSYIAYSIIYKWIISWGGAKYIKGWKSVFFTDMESSDWSTEQIRLMTLFLWLIYTILFLIGLFHPEYRFFKST